MTDLDEPLAQALRDAVPQPPRELDPEALRSAAPPRRARTLGPALVAAAIVVIAVGAGLVEHHRSTSNAGPDRPFGAVKHGPPPSAPTDPVQITARAVERLLAATPTLPGATSVAHSPVKALRKPDSVWGSANLVLRTGWWTGPGTMSDAIAYFTAHPPAGTKGSGTSTSGDRGGVTGMSVSFEPAGRRSQRPTVYTGLELVVQVVPADGGVAVRVDAEAVWLPQRIAAEHIPDDVTSVNVVVERNGGAPTVRRTLGAAEARALAGLVNRLPVLGSGTISCPVMRGWTDTLTFHGPSGDLMVDADADGCQSVTVGPRSQHNPTLSGGGTVDRALLRALGLPPHYGQ